jgi:hypothetical protein
MSESGDPVAEATERLEAAVARLGRAVAGRPAPMTGATGGADPAAIAALAARLDATIVKLRGVLGEEG